MSVRHLLLTSLAAMVAAGAVLAAMRLDLLWLAVLGLSGAFAAGGVFLHFRNSRVLAELGVLREHLDSTRQHAALLARHTRELRDAFAQSTAKIMEARADAGSPPADVLTLGSLVHELANAVAELDMRTERAETELVDLRMDARQRRVAPEWPQMPAQAYAPQGFASPAPAPAPRAPEARIADPLPFGVVTGTPPRADGRAENEPPRAVRQLVSAAIAADRFDLFLQRVVTLPQRKTRAYDVTLRPEGSDLAVPNSDIRLSVEAVGHQLAFDRKLMIQAVRLARVFEERDRDVRLFVDVSQRYLMSETAFEELIALLKDAPQAAQRIVMCLPHRFFRKAIALDHDAIRRLRDFGFTFSVRDLDDFDFEPERLARIGVQWVRMQAGRCIEALQERDTVFDVAAADFATVLARAGLVFVADHVTNEALVAEMLDLNAGYACGPAIALPQAVRPDVLEGAPQQKAPMAQAAARMGLRDLARRA